MRIHKQKLEWDTFLDNNLNDRTKEKFQHLHRFYKSTDGVLRYTNIEDAVQSISQLDWIEIGKLLAAKDLLGVGVKLDSCLFHICAKDARYELMEEFDKLTEEE